MNKRDDFDKSFERIWKLGTAGVVALAVISLIVGTAVLGAFFWLVIAVVNYLQSH